MNKPTTIDEIIIRLRNIGTEAYNCAYEIHGENNYERAGARMKIEDEIADEVKAELAQLIRECVPEKYEIKDHKNIGDGTGYYHDIGYNTAINQINQSIKKIMGDI